MTGAKAETPGTSADIAAETSSTHSATPLHRLCGALPTRSSTMLLEVHTAANLEIGANAEAPMPDSHLKAMAGNQSQRGTRHAAAPVALRWNNRQMPQARLLAKGLQGLLQNPAADESRSDRQPAPPTVAPPGIGAHVPLAEAVKSSEAQDIQGMLNAARARAELTGMLDERNLRRQTPLHIAADAGRREVVELLLDYGAPTNVVDSRGETALHKAAAGGHSSVVLLLLERGAMVLSDKQGQTALHRAAGRGHATAVAVMLRHGEAWFESFAESFDRGESEGGSTPLHVATVAGHADVVSAIMAGFSHDREKLEQLKTTSNRWGDVPAAMVEGEAPAILTACVRETQKQRREAHQRMQDGGKNALEGRRWCDMPMTPTLPVSVKRKVEKDARQRSHLVFETVRQELRAGGKTHEQPSHAERADEEHEDGYSAQKEKLPEDAGCRTPGAIRKTTFNIALLPNGEVDLECIYQRSPVKEDFVDGGHSRGEQRARAESSAADFDLHGDEEQDFISADCEFEFNFDLMGVCGDSESEDEQSADDCPR